MEIMDRIIDFRRVPASELRPNPKNWRIHPDGQKEGLRTVLAEIGMVDAVIARELPDGGLELVDGHLRTETVTDTPIPCLILDITEEESDIVLSTLDPLASLASPNLESLASLMKSVMNNGNERLDILLEDVQDKYNLGFLEMGSQDTEADYADHDYQAGEVQNNAGTGTKAVVLHLQEDEYEEFYSKAFDLGDTWGIDNLADVILACVRKVAEETNGTG